MSAKIKAITVEAFRGIPASGITLDLDGKGLIIRGDNGTGKSSIVDAIEFFFSGHLKSLEKDQPLSVSKHAPHINCTAEQVNIKLSMTPGPVELSRSFTSSTAPPPELKPYFEIAAKGTCILRRAQILEFITSKPADRFRSVSDIIGIGNLDQYELTLKHVNDSFSEELGKLRSAIQEQETIIHSTLGCAPSELDAILEKINAKLKQSSLAEVQSLDNLGIHSQNLLRSIRSNTDRSRLVVIGNIAALTGTGTIIIPWQDMLPLLEQINYLNAKLVTEENRKLGVLNSLLQNGKKTVATWNTNTCPLCEQPIQIKDLDDSLSKRLSLIRALSDQISEVSRHISSIREYVRSGIDKLQNIFTLTSSIPELCESSSKIHDMIEEFKVYLQIVVDSSSTNLPINLEILKQRKDELSEYLTKLNQQCVQLIQQERLTDLEEALLKAIELLQTMDMAIKKHKQVIAKSQVLAQYADASSKIYNSFVTTKKAVVQKVYDIIQTDIERYYKFLHPNDDYENIKLTLTRRASVELKIDSHGKANEDPRAYSSEGHLDTLGLCIFLAFINKFNQDCSLVVLDDVVTTVDGQHRNVICQLIHNQFCNKQFIITTHELYWFKQLEAYFTSVGLRGQFQFIEIDSWDIVSGPVFSPFKTRWEQIQAKYDIGDRTVGNDTRIHLEAVLKQICECFETPVVFKRNGLYTVGHLLPPAKSRIKKLIEDCQYKTDALEAFQKLESTLICSNLLSHDNSISDDIPISDIRLFVDCVKNLSEKTLCPQCKAQVKYSQEFQIVRCVNCEFEVGAR